MPPISEHVLVANGTKFLAPSALLSLKGSNPERPLPHIREKKEGKGREIKEHLQVTAYLEGPRCSCGPSPAPQAPMASTYRLRGDSLGSSQKAEPQ